MHPPYSQFCPSSALIHTWNMCMAGTVKPRPKPLDAPKVSTLWSENPKQPGGLIDATLTTTSMSFREASEQLNARWGLQVTWHAHTSIHNCSGTPCYFLLMSHHQEFYFKLMDYCWYLCNAVFGRGFRFKVLATNCSCGRNDTCCSTYAADAARPTNEEPLNSTGQRRDAGTRSRAQVNHCVSLL